MDFKKLSNLQKWYLKYANNKAYKDYKRRLQQHKYESFKKEQLEKNNAAFEKKSIQHAGIFQWRNIAFIGKNGCQSQKLKCIRLQIIG